MIYSKGEPLKKVPTEQLVDELFKEIDRYYAAGKSVQRDERAAAEAREWLAQNEDTHADDARANGRSGGRSGGRGRRGARVDARAGQPGRGQALHTTLKRASTAGQLTTFHQASM